MDPRRLLKGVMLVLPLGLQGQDPVHRRLTVKDGLPSNTVYCALQDGQGHMWFGTDAGVARYDGRYMDRLTVSDGLSDNDVFLIKEDHQGRVWFLTGNGRPSYWRDGSIHHAGVDTVLREVVVPSGIRTFHEDRAGRVWFGGLSGEMVSLDTSGHVDVFRMNDGDPDKPGARMTLAPGTGVTPQAFSDTHPVVFEGGGRWHSEPGGMPLGGQDGRVDASPDGRVMQTQPHAVREWIGGRWTVLPLDGTGLLARTYRRACPAHTGDLLLLLEEGGLRWYRPGAERWGVVRPDMFGDDLVNDALVDREGNHWICTVYGGVILFTTAEANTAFYPGTRGGKEEFLRLVMDPARPGTLWCGTNQGDLYRLDGSWQMLDLDPPGAVFIRVNDLVLRGDEAWVALDNRVMRVDLRGTIPVQQVVLAGDSNRAGMAQPIGMKALTMRPDGTLLGSYYGLYLEDGISDPPVMRRTLQTAVPPTRIYAPHYDPRGVLWFEEQGQLLRMDGDTTRVVHELPPNIRVTDLASVGDTLVVATMGEGLRFIHADREVGRITTAEGLVSDRIRHVQVSGARIMVSTIEGASLVELTGPGPRVLNFTTRNGLPEDDVRDAAADTEHAYLLLPEGLCVLPLHQPARSSLVPVPYVRAIMVNDSLVQGTGFTVRQGRDRLRVRFSAVHFGQPETMRLEYRLDTDVQWHATNTGDVEFGGLATGPGTVLLRAGLDGVSWSAPVRVAFTVVPPFWKSWWAITGAVLALGVLTFLLLRHLAFRRFRSRMERLRQREELTRERQRIAMDLHDDLGAELGSLLLLTRMEAERAPSPVLARMEHMTHSLTEKVNEVIWSSDPEHDGLEATVAFIERYITDQCRFHGLVFRRQGTPALPSLSLPAGVRRELFLVAKEIMTNVLKHAGATSLVFTVGRAGDALELTFADDGRGLAADGGPSLGHGLTNIHRRIAAFGGTFELAPGARCGAVATVQLPLQGLVRSADADTSLPE